LNAVNLDIDLWVRWNIKDCRCHMTDIITMTIVGLTKQHQALTTGFQLMNDNLHSVKSSS